jgi:tryptophanyl-tRNA synthetase
VGARIMSLQDPTSKMSKSDPDLNATIFLTDSSDTIEKKIKRAVTDSGTEVTYEDSKPGVKNLVNIQSAITGKSTQEIVTSYTGKMYGHLKMDTAKIVAEAVAPIRAEVDRLLADKSYLEGILKRGAERARARARPLVEEVYRRIGFLPK